MTCYFKVINWSGILFSGRSVKEFVEACKKATGVDIKVDYLERRPGDYAEVFSDPMKINRELNWTAKYTNLQESLKTAWRWQKAHRDGYGTPLVMSSWNIVAAFYSHEDRHRSDALLTSAAPFRSVRWGVLELRLIFLSLHKASIVDWL